MANKSIVSKYNPYLEEIITNLRKGHAAIMIGAGFSKNAQNNGSKEKRFPDWGELGDIFYEKLNGSKPKSDHKAYLNVLKLADEVQATFKRPALDDILLNEIPDKEFQPSPLHQKLLELPWTDVFTTNYDTLLERSAEKIIERRYEPIFNTTDLIQSTKPRIIKLHGSFPSSRPFIITEEDYRTYPKKFAPFVNTVQQSLLENTLCLIGFSGDDPNFLNWIGWIRDNLGEDNSPNIYMIGLLNLTPGQEKLLNKRNIVPIDLTYLSDFKSNHYEAIKFFIKYLSDNIKNNNKLGWPEKNKSFYPRKEKGHEIIKSITNEWKELRKSYPNWLIVPEDRRNVLIQYTQSAHELFPKLENIDVQYDIEFLYEYNWRIEKCLYPIDNSIISQYENIIKRYNPFPEKIQIENTANPYTLEKLNWKDIHFWWVELQISVLRYYREEGFIEKWKDLSNLLNKLKTELSSEQKAKFSYESCLYHLFSLHISNVRKEISNWTTDITLPYWEAKKASLLAELGDISEAKKILDTSLNAIRSRSYLSPISNDFFNVSREAYIMLLKRDIDYSLDIKQGVYFWSEKNKKEYNDRWNNLLQFKCDPRAETKAFNTYLEKEPIKSKTTEQKYGFDLDNLSRTFYLGKEQKYTNKAYSYLRYIEEVGIPYRLPNVLTLDKKATNAAISHITNQSSYWALASFMRHGEREIKSSIYDRKSLSKMNQEDADNYIQNYLTVLENSKTEIKNGNPYNKFNFAISLSTVIPEVLSKLCSISSSNTKLELLKFLKTTFESEYRDNYKGIKNLTRRLIASFSDEEILKNIPLLMQFPIIPEPKNAALAEYIEPFKFIDSSNLRNTINIKIDTHHIDHLISLAENIDKRELVLVRLIRLWELALIPEEQINKIAKLLWNKIDKKTGFPSDTNYYNFAFINLPHPKNKNPEELLRNYITATPFDIIAHKKERRISMTGGNIRICIEIEGTTNPDINFTWKKKDIALLVSRLIEWWDSDKKYLQKNDANQFGSTHDEFKYRFDHLHSILSEIVSVHIEYVSREDLINLKRIISEASEYNLPHINTKAAFCHVFPEFQNEVKSLIFNNLFARSRDKVVDALSACVKLIKSSSQDTIDLVKLISENIRSLLNTDLKGFLNVITFVVSDHSDLLDDKILNDLQIGLNNLIPETKIEEEDTDEQVHYKLIYRREAAHLTVALSKYFTSQKINIPDYVSQWKELCINPNEFAEIRNVWVNALSE